MTMAALLRLGLTLALGALGGWVFNSLGVPLPWLLGAMVFTMLGALLKLPVISARRIRAPFAAIVGVSIGSAFTAAALASWSAWLLLMGFALLALVVVSVVNYAYLRHVAGFDPATAYFAGVPGGVYEMVVQGTAAGGDERHIALTQASRIFLVVIIVPLVVSLFSGEVRRFDVVAPPLSAYTPQAMMVLVACLLGWPLGHLVRLPNAAILGPMALSIAVHALGLTSLPPPAILVTVAQIVLGASIGSGFAGTPVAGILRTLGHGLVLFPIAIALVLGIGVLASAVTAHELAVVFLSLAPGGMMEMSLIAVAIGADVAVVTTQHLARILVVHSSAPLVFRLFRGRRPGRTD